MSVYTNIRRPELEAFLDDYSLGELLHYTGINAGIENTNYFVTTENGEFVLTIFEHLDFNTLPYYLHLMAHLSDHGMPTAHPIADLHGDYIGTLKHKPAALVRRLEGRTVHAPTRSHCVVVGHALAQLHIIGKSFDRVLTNPRGIDWCQRTTQRVLQHLSDADRELLQRAMLYRQRSGRADLPRGVIHADLFRDNVMFQAHSLSGIIDFYYACNDYLLYDLAITVNDWCSLKNGELDRHLYTALIDAYRVKREFQQAEVDAWGYMLRAAALRFWLSRLQDRFFPRDGEITHIKDSDVFRNILRARIEHAPSLYH